MCQEKKSDVESQYNDEQGALDEAYQVEIERKKLQLLGGHVLAALRDWKARAAGWPKLHIQSVPSMVAGRECCPGLLQLQRKST